MDFAPLTLAPLVAGALAIFTNTVPPIAADGDFHKGEVALAGRIAHAELGGGRDGIDYQLRFTVRDADNNVFRRTALLMVCETS